jgi:hypothetical protein
MMALVSGSLAPASRVQGTLNISMLTVVCTSGAVARRVVQATARNDSARCRACAYR